MKITTGCGEFELVPDGKWRDRVGKYDGQVPFLLGGKERGVAEMFGGFNGIVTGTIYLDPTAYNLLKQMLTGGAPMGIGLSVSAKPAQPTTVSEDANMMTLNERKVYDALVKLHSMDGPGAIFGPSRIGDYANYHGHSSPSAWSVPILRRLMKYGLVGNRDGKYWLKERLKGKPSDNDIVKITKLPECDSNLADVKDFFYKEKDAQEFLNHLRRTLMIYEGEPNTPATQNAIKSIAMQEIAIWIRSERVRKPFEVDAVDGDEGQIIITFRKAQS